MATYPMPSAGQFNTPAFQTFLANHREFASLTSRKQINTFLTNHPQIASRYMALIGGTTSGGTVSTGTATAPVTTLPPAGPTAEQASARGIINTALAAYGLGSLAEWAWQQYLNGTPTSQLMLDLRSRPEYKARFPGMDALAKKGRAISEDQYIGLEQQYVTRARAYGLPPSFYDDVNDFGTLIASEVSPEEYESRLQIAARYSNDSPEATRLRDEYARLYGPLAGQGAAISYMIDPTKALDVLQRQHEATLAANQAATTGFGTLTRQQAETVGSLGLTEQAQAQRFGELATMDEFKTQLNSGEIAVTDDDLIAAGFVQNADAQKKVERVRAGRVAAFAGGGGFATSQRGVTGLGTAN